jgi:DNA polymerase I-like protein with 3'-5' exonuclease and polymerase domains
LEWRCASFLSQDETAIKEILDGTDQHSDNQLRFGLPSRLIAKTFVFRLIYGGSAYSYANDPNFSDVSKSEKYWQGVIDEFYSKYKGLHKWHTKLMQEATTTGMVKLPTGRIYQYKSEDRRGEKVWPRTTILNYPVQGLGADLMSIARVSLFNRMRKLGYEKAKLINTVHDSIIIDCDDSHTDTLAKMMLQVFEDIPKNFEKLFGVEFNIPMKGEVKTGKTWGDLKEFDNSSKK